ncbi:Protein of unknown function DUF1647 family-containing protein [Aphelenchoides besseyi]|nr:Protein of unknown function DUF1647 family-containing protein [Aphelenchoides besseyi]
MCSFRLNQRKYSFLSNSIAQRVSPKLVGRLLSIYEVVVHFIRLNLCRIVLFIGFFLLLELVLLSDGVTQFLNENDLANYEKNNPKSSVSMSVNESLTTKISTSSATIPTAKLDLCNCNGENFCFTGLDEVGNVRLGLPFNCSLYEKLKSLQLLDSDAANAKPDYKQIVADDNWSPVFVTSVSISHFRELRNFVRTIRTHYPKSKIVIFDVGLQRKEIQELKSWCLVEYRRFEFSKYPPHVKKIMNYSFKLAIIEAFQTYKTFFYLDTSVRIKSKNLATFLQGVQSGVLLPFIVNVYLFAITVNYHSDARTLIHGPIYKWYLCALTEHCIDPPVAKVACFLSPRTWYDLRRTYI